MQATREKEGIPKEIIIEVVVNELPQLTRYVG